jgi:hypothetical protein
MLSITLQLHRSKLTVFNISQPPSSSALESRASESFSVLLGVGDLTSIICFLLLLRSIRDELLITCDFNLYLDDLTNPRANQFLIRFNSGNRKQLIISSPIHRGNHILYLFVTRADTAAVSQHFFIPSLFRTLFLFYLIFLLSLLYLILLLSFRCFKTIYIEKFRLNLLHAFSSYYSFQSDLADFVNIYDSIYAICHFC